MTKEVEIKKPQIEMPDKQLVLLADKIVAEINNGKIKLAV